MSENTHPAVAKFRQEGVHEWQAGEGSTDATNLAAILDAQVEATLALAYEQCTANLLAYRALANSIILSGTPLTVEFAEQVDSIDKQIIERMGL